MRSKTNSLFRFAQVSKSMVILAVLWFGTTSTGFAASPPSSNEALGKLKKGNARFVSGKYKHPRMGLDRRLDTFKNGQHPFATVIACSDSRVTPEMLFDQGIGHIFTIRVAGNVCDVDEVGSIEYGVDHLGTPIFVVLGHRSCGAVTAVVTNAEVHGSIPQLVDNIKPAVETARRKNPNLHGKALVPAAAKENVWQSIDDLFQRSAAVRKRVKSGKLKVVGAVYDLEKGGVEWLGTHPKQGKMLSYTGGGGHGTNGHSSNGHAESHSVHRNHIAVFSGATNNIDKEHTDFTLGAEYEYRLPFLQNRLGIGVIGERVFADQAENILAGAALLHLGKGLKFLMAPGVVFAKHKAESSHGVSGKSETVKEFLFRTGVAKDFHVATFSVTPALNFDLIKGNLSVIYGMTFGRGF